VSASNWLRHLPLRCWLLVGYGWIVLALTVLLPPGDPVRIAAVFVFVLTGPGLGISAVLTRDIAERWVLTIALSASLAILVSVVMTVMRNESTPLRIALLAAVNTVAAVVWGVHAGKVVAA